MAKRGLGSPKVSVERRRAWAKAAGKKAQQSGRAHRWDSESGAQAADIAHLNRQRKKAAEGKPR